MYLSFISLLLLFGGAYSATSILTVEITNVSHPEGKIRVALYKPSSEFGTMHAKPDFGKIIEVKSLGKHRVEFDVEPGTYAVSMYHDLNSNEKLDKNLVGYPKEPFGFSNNFRPVFSGPKFKDCAFTHSERGTTISIKLTN